MMSTTNKIMVDSSVFIEALKGRKTDFYKSLISTNTNQFYINEIILSEYLYYLLAINGGSSPKSLQESKLIKSVFSTSSNELVILKDFILLSSSQEFSEIVPSFMSTYNLLPNDAIILATCKLHGITQLASHDTDFVIPCKQEGIELLTES